MRIEIAAIIMLVAAFTLVLVTNLPPGYSDVSAPADSAQTGLPATASPVMSVGTASLIGSTTVATPLLLPANGPDSDTP